MTHASQQVNPQPTPPAATFILQGQLVTVHDLYRSTGTFQTFVRDIEIRRDGQTLARYEVIEARRRLTCARTAGKWDAPETCYADLAEHAVQYDAALHAAIVNRLAPHQWICVLPGACLTGTLDGQTLTIRTGDDVVASHAIVVRKTGRSRYAVPGVGSWGDSLSAIRDLIRAAALPYLNQGTSA